MTLGELIDFLKRQDPKRVASIGIHDPYSYRGYYTDLAFEVAFTEPVGEMLKVASKALGATFPGYKGGNYRMDRDTDCWLVTEGRGDAVRLTEELLEYLFNAPVGEPDD